MNHSQAVNQIKQGQREESLNYIWDLFRCNEMFTTSNFYVLLLEASKYTSSLYLSADFMPCLRTILWTFSLSITWNRVPWEVTILPSHLSANVKLLGRAIILASYQLYPSCNLNRGKWVLLTEKSISESHNEF